jgi:hypothetical protein
MIKRTTYGIAPAATPAKTDKSTAGRKYEEIQAVKIVAAKEIPMTELTCQLCPDCIIRLRV